MDLKIETMINKNRYADYLMLLVFIPIVLLAPQYVVASEMDATDGEIVNIRTAWSTNHARPGDSISLAIVADIKEAMERLAPQGIEYMHNLKWGDGNGHSHVKASLMGPSLTIPFIEGELCLGTWQQIVFLELDTRSRTRNLISQIIGE